MSEDALHEAKPITLTGQDFLESTWVLDGEKAEKQREVSDNYSRWRGRVTNLDLLSQATKLWNYFTSGNVTGKDKAVIVGALLYLISPVDFIPDWIPVVGWLDDLGVATFTLNFVVNKLGTTEASAVQICHSPFEEAEIYPQAVPKRLTTLHQTASYEGLPYKISQLSSFATDLGCTELANMASALNDDMCGTTFRVLFAGRYNTGKSTLLNALLGSNYLPVGPKPTTRAISYILSSKTEALFSEQPNGKIVQHESIGDLLDESNEGLKQAIKVTLLLPGTKLADGIAFVDSPGLEDPRQEITQLTLDEIPKADAIVLVLDAKYPESASEFSFVSNLLDRDRERKLFFVLNRLDKVDENERSGVISATHHWLKKAGVADPQIFPLSAAQAFETLSREPFQAPEEFTAFRSKLVAFLNEGSPTELRRIRQKRADSIQDGLLDACETALQLSAMCEEKKLQALREIHERGQKCQEELSRQEAIIERRMRAVRERFHANFLDFMGVMRADLNDIVDRAAKVDDLPTSNSIERTMKDGIRSFSETELTAACEELSLCVQELAAKMQTTIHGLQAPVSVNRAKSLLERSPEIATAGLLILSFPLTGFFNFAYLAIGMAFGASSLQSLIRSLSAEVALRHVRPEMKQQISDRIHELQSKMSQEFENAFDELQSRAISSLREQVALMRGATFEMLTSNENDLSVSTEMAKSVSAKLLALQDY